MAFNKYQCHYDELAPTYITTLQTLLGLSSCREARFLGGVSDFKHMHRYKGVTFETSIIFGVIVILVMFIWNYII